MRGDEFMQAREVKSAADARRIVEERGIKHVKLGLLDIDGILRGKYVARDKFFSALESGFGFCDVVLGWDANDQLVDNLTYTGWHTAYPDAPARIVPESCREIPFEPETLFFLAEFAPPAETICPRGLLKRVLERAKGLGFTAYSALEYEFFLFEETPHSVREKNYRNLKSITPGYFGYSVLRSTVLAEFYHELLQLCETMDMSIEGLHTETGAGVLEAAIAVDSALAMSDKAVLFKTFTKALAQRRGWMATFMAKWSRDWPGQSGHLHLSLKDRDGKGVFHDPAAPHNMSKTMRHFLAGQQLLMPQILAMISPTVNSYTRLIPGYWAPTHSTWGVENRTCALRVIPGSREVAAHRVSRRRRRRQSLHRHRGGPRRRPLGHRERARADRSHPGQFLREEAPGAARFAGHAMGCGAAPQGLEAGPRLVRRRLRRALCRDARMGGAREPQAHLGLAAAALFRDYLRQGAGRSQALQLLPNSLILSLPAQLACRRIRGKTRSCHFGTRAACPSTCSLREQAQDEAGWWRG